MTTRKRLLFVSPSFLFPADTGGKIRTSQVLRGMKGGAFDITLLSPMPVGGTHQFKDELNAVADYFSGWPEPRRARAFRITRMRHLLSALPIPVRTDRSRAGKRLVAQELDKHPDLVVFDFPHSAVLAPLVIPIPSVMFTHNVESEIFRRHAAVAKRAIIRAVWRNQLRKMRSYEGATLQRFDTVVAVSTRDKEYFEKEYGVRNVSLIRTGVDLDYFTYSPPGTSGGAIFMGSMDWLANIDGVEYLAEEIWPRVLREMPAAKMTVVGRTPPARLVQKAREKRHRIEFTGYVPDVRSHVRSASVFVIPLRVGGGTRIKVFEAMAMGCPVVSTSIGVEGLSLRDQKHYLCADTPDEFAAAVLRILQDKDLRNRLSREARAFVESRSSVDAAKDFERICLRLLEPVESTVQSIAAR